MKIQSNSEQMLENHCVGPVSVQQGPTVRDTINSSILSRMVRRHIPLIDFSGVIDWIIPKNAIDWYRASQFLNKHELFACLYVTMPSWFPFHPSKPRGLSYLIFELVPLTIIMRKK